MTKPKKINYLANKEILAEIHKSKNSYSYYIDDKYSRFDIIVEKIEDITDQLILDTKIERARKETFYKKQFFRENENIFEETDIVTFNDYSDEDMVFRVKTFDHIPDDPGRVKKPKNIADTKVKLKFPPFKHYAFIGNELKEVGRSHWTNGLDNGYFTQETGKISNKLAMMYKLLVDRYGSKGSWRYYCVDTETEALTQRGWLGIDDINENDIIMSYDNGNMKWSSIKSIYRGHYTGKMHKIYNQTVDMLVTPNHKLVTNRGIIPVELLKEKDSIVLMGNSIINNKKVYTDNFVKLAAWIITEGSYLYNKNTNNIKSISIYQNDGPKADKIRNILEEEGYEYSEFKKIDSELITFRIFKKYATEFEKIFNKKDINMPFLLNLSTSQLSIFLDTLIEGDGWNRSNNNRSYSQKSDKHSDLFQALVVMTGSRLSRKKYDIESFGKNTNINIMNIFSKKKNNTLVENLNFNGGKNNIGKGKQYHPNKPTVEYDGNIWCPETEYGCFVARRNNTVYLTGNSYNEEMRGQALVQLIAVGLQFDESKSDNPFAYYTSVCKTSFTKVLNDEKRSQEIRDDLLSHHGVAPSMSRQVSNSITTYKLANGDVDFNKSKNIPFLKKNMTKE